MIKNSCQLLLHWVLVKTTVPKHWADCSKIWGTWHQFLGLLYRIFVRKYLSTIPSSLEGPKTSKSPNHEISLLTNHRQKSSFGLCQTCTPLTSWSPVSVLDIIHHTIVSKLSFLYTEQNWNPTHNYTLSQKIFHIWFKMRKWLCVWYANTNLLLFDWNLNL